MSTSVPPADVTLRLVIPSEWDRVNLVRQAVQHAVHAATGDPDLHQALAMVSSELLENAIKYGADPDLVHFSLENHGGRLVVAVSSALRSDGSSRALEERLRWILEFPTPAEAYAACLAAQWELLTATPDAAPRSGGLGLVRIAYEGGCELEADWSREGWVTVRASHAPPRSPPT